LVIVPQMSDMQYISTRGETDPMGFRDAVMTGLAPDGGLMIPARIPAVKDRMGVWAGLSYRELAFEVFRLFTDLPDEDLHALIHDSYSVFRHPEVAPLVRAGPVRILELFHGPTLAFKDIALQFLSNLFEHILEERGSRLNILGATSGDTGSAAIHGVRGRRRIRIFMMHPAGRVAPLQERQMTTVLDGNVFNLAVNGTFDDCQRIMKDIFGDLKFKEQYALGAVNSVNWARVLAQIVYFIHAALQTRKSEGVDQVRFAVPTGNFGDILAGWYAKQMGAPISRLVLATNENDILARFFNSGTYCSGEVIKSISPSMDIQVASNFERYLYYRVGEDSTRLRNLMDEFRVLKSISVEQDNGEAGDYSIAAGVGTTDQTLVTIRENYERYGYILDPHTAVGVHVANSFLDDDEPMICLATAHAAKFPAAILDATGETATHDLLDGILDVPSRCVTVPDDSKSVREYIAKHGG